MILSNIRFVTGSIHNLFHDVRADWGCGTRGRDPRLLLGSIHHGVHKICQFHLIVKYSLRIDVVSVSGIGSVENLHGIRSSPLAVPVNCAKNLPRLGAVHPRCFFIRPSYLSVYPLKRGEVFQMKNFICFS